MLSLNAAVSLVGFGSSGRLRVQNRRRGEALFFTDLRVNLIRETADLHGEC